MMALNLLSLLPFMGLASASVIRRGPTPCHSLHKPHIPGVEVISITSEEKHDFSVPQQPPTLPIDVNGLNVCEVNLTLTHRGASDKVFVRTWLPLSDWNSRFVALGGSGWAAGPGPAGLAIPASEGYATAYTDAGLPGGDPASPAAWALGADGKVNGELLENFASRSVHDLAVAGKALTEAFYGRSAEHSFWNGCSTGGRQGLAAAQKYPEDFDGILAGAPAIYWTEYVIAELWPQVVMHEAGHYPPICALDGMVNAAIAACDENDGVRDGVITEPSKCKFDPSTLVGTKVTCDDAVVEIKKEDASIVRKIWDGPTIHGKKLWPGMPIGASLSSVASWKDANGTTVGTPFFVADTWVRYFVEEDADFDVANIDTDAFVSLFHKSEALFDSVIGSADPDLSGFKKAGGKLLVWHGLSDQLIFPQDSVKYYDAARSSVGDIEDTMRLFLAPGVDHCGAALSPIAPGAVPSDPFADLVKWVESGEAPGYVDAATLPTAETEFTRKVCAYPQVARLRDGADPAVAESYECQLGGC